MIETLPTLMHVVSQEHLEKGERMGQTEIQTRLRFDVACPGIRVYASLEGVIIHYACYLNGGTD